MLIILIVTKNCVLHNKAYIYVTTVNIAQIKAFLQHHGSSTIEYTIKNLLRLKRCASLFLIKNGTQIAISPRKGIKTNLKIQESQKI